MSNATELNNTAPLDDEFEEPENLAVKYVWLFGIVVSSLCFITQAVLLYLRPKIRKLDQKILTHLAAARLMNTILEYVMSHLLFNYYTKDLTFALYLQTDIVLVCWMFIYTKNLYDKVVLVFALQQRNFLLLSILIWVLTIPIGVLMPVFIQINVFDEAYRAYAWLKFLVLAVNLLLYGKIFYVIITRNRNSNRNFTDIIKTCVISLILVCITSLQVFLTDILTYFESGDIVTDTFCILNSFQVVAVTIIFLILAKNCV
ncbi:unnamed protein product [Chrysodeixis includens]|uniref:Uncharacterized protein n=1 Tax=Chrysodeixis includens TaxID=689277 RepID=A0A9P0C5Y9_CHRIL|nr:unnamed protein product [Chrysodeixis includens]